MASSDETDAAMPVAQHLDRLDGQAVVQGNPLSRLQRAAGLAHRDPAVVGRRANEQHLGRRPGGARTEQTGVTHPCGVEHQQVTGGDQRGDLREPRIHQHAALHRAAVARLHGGLTEGIDGPPAAALAGAAGASAVGAHDPAVGPEHHEQAARRPLRQGLLGDELRRKLVVEVGGAGGLSRQRSWPARRAAE
jgi:hypothetical protein